MPPLPPVSKIVRVDLFSSYLQAPNVRNRFFFSYTGAGGVLADFNTIGGTISSSWNTNFSPLLSTSYTLNTILLTDLTSASATQTTVNAARAGTNAAAVLSGGVAAIVKFKVARRYRGGHPRFYLTGIPQANLASTGLWTTTFTGNLNNAWNALITSLTTTPPASFGTIAQVNVSFFLGFTNKTNLSGRTRPVPTPRGTPLVDPVISITVNNKPASQRRRNVQSA